MFEKISSFGKVEKLLGNFNLDPRMIVQIVKTYAGYLEIVKEWEHYTPPSKEKPPIPGENKYLQMKKKLKIEDKNILTKKTEDKSEGNQRIGKLTMNLSTIKKNIGIVKELLEHEAFEDEVIMVSR